MRLRLALRHGCIALALAIAGPAFADKASDTLNVEWQPELPTLNPYFNTDHTQLTLGQNVFDGLVWRDTKTGEYKPLLAKSWKLTSPTTLEFELRDDVKFHDGEALDADDVVATLNWAVDPANKVLVRQMVGWIERAEKTGTHTLTIHMKLPTAAALEYLATSVPILPSHMLVPEKIEAFGKLPVGTGPYKIKSFAPGDEYVMSLNADYFEGSPKGKATIGTIRIKTVKDANLRIASLISGSADYLWQLTPDQAENLSAMGGVTVGSSATQRTMWVLVDAAGRAGKHPFNDIKVRQALAHAVNREAIVKNLVRGSSELLNSFCYPQQVGCPDTAEVYSYDPAKARALLAEAGYPNGFQIELSAVDDREVVEAVIGDLAAVGISAKLNWMIFPPFREKWANGELPLMVIGSGFWGIGDASIAFGSYFNDAPQDMMRDADVNGWVREAAVSDNLEAREALYAKATQRINDQVALVPLYTKPNNFATSVDLDFAPSYDEINRFYLARWK